VPARALVATFPAPVRRRPGGIPCPRAPSPLDRQTTIGTCPNRQNDPPSTSTRPGSKGWLPRARSERPRGWDDVLASNVSSGRRRGGLRLEADAIWRPIVAGPSSGDRLVDPTNQAIEGQHEEIASVAEPLTDDHAAERDQSFSDSDQTGSMTLHARCAVAAHSNADTAPMRVTESRGRAISTRWRSIGPPKCVIATLTWQSTGKRSRCARGRIARAPP
jgi:hypothetical protein